MHGELMKSIPQSPWCVGKLLIDGAREPVGIGRETIAAELAAGPKRFDYWKIFKHVMIDRLISKCAVAILDRDLRFSVRPEVGL